VPSAGTSTVLCSSLPGVHPPAAVAKSAAGAGVRAALADALRLRLHKGDAAEEEEEAEPEETGGAKALISKMKKAKKTKRRVGHGRRVRDS